MRKISLILLFLVCFSISNTFLLFSGTSSSGELDEIESTDNYRFKSRSFALEDGKEFTYIRNYVRVRPQIFNGPKLYTRSYMRVTNSMGKHVYQVKELNTSEDNITLDQTKPVSPGYTSAYYELEANGNNNGWATARVYWGLQTID